MKEFSFSTRIYFGEGALDRLKKVKNKTVMIVTDKFMASIGIVERISSYLTNCEISVYDGVIPDPTIEVITQGVTVLAACQAQVMIAVGGGSTIDAAKAIRVVAGEAGLVNTDKMQCYAIPTTSGTGSEVTDYSVITDNEKEIKYPLHSIELRPVTAILDPSLVVTVPPRVTADAGMDVLTHAMEAYVSGSANDFSDALCEKAISLICEYLPIAYRQGDNLLAREKVHNASCMAGLAFNSAGLGVAHGISHTLGAKFHIAHGRANAMVLPYVMEFNSDIGRVTEEYSNVAKKYHMLARKVGLSGYNLRIGVAALINEIRRLNSYLDIPETLCAYGIPKEQFQEEFDDLVRNAMEDATTLMNPKTINQFAMAGLIRKIGGYE